MTILHHQEVLVMLAENFPDHSFMFSLGESDPTLYINGQKCDCLMWENIVDSEITTHSGPDAKTELLEIVREQIEEFLNEPARIS